MTTVTLEQIESRQSELADLIAKFKQQVQTPALPTEVTIAPTTIALAPGELYAGLLLGDDGKPSHHLVLLPQRGEDLDWNDACEFAEEAGGELPTRREQSLLFANLKQHFKAVWYWSGEQHQDDGSYAWYQYFYFGSQGHGYKSYEARAVAVRRLPA